MILVHVSGSRLRPDMDNAVRVQLVEGQWFKKMRNGAVSGMASRQEIMMVLQNIQNILIK